MLPLALWTDKLVSHQLSALQASAILILYVVRLRKEQSVQLLQNVLQDCAIPTESAVRLLMALRAHRQQNVLRVFAILVINAARTRPMDHAMLMSIV